MRSEWRRRGRPRLEDCSEERFDGSGIGEPEIGEVETAVKRDQ